MIGHHLTRRDLMKVSVFGAAAITLPLERVVRAKSVSRIAASKLPRPFTVPFAFAVPPVLAPGRRSATTDYFELTQRQSVVQILPGVNTPVFAYNGSVPGPTIQMRQGREAVVRQINALPATHPTLGYLPWTSTHLHDSASRPEYDGYASGYRLTLSTGDPMTVIATDGGLMPAPQQVTQLRHGALCLNAA
jgi:FtsP/CotA-like multicopper oxidase with cupredoxin domain